MRTILAFLLLIATAYAEPIPKINGPTEADPYELVVIDSSESTCAARNWLIDTSDVQIPEQETDELAELVNRLRSLGVDVEFEAPEDGPLLYLVVNEGKAVVLANYPGTYRLFLSVSDADGCASALHTVKRQGIEPLPPGPEPGPEPEPQPQPSLGVKEVVQRGVEGRASLDTKVMFLSLSQVYTLISESIEEGDLGSGEAIESATRTFSNRVLMDDADVWISIVENYLGPKLKELEDAGKLQTPDQYAIVWREIAAGLRDGVANVF